MYQAIRRSGTLPDDASFFLVATLIDDITLRDADVLREYQDRLKALEKQYGLGEGSVWPAGTAPAGYDELRQQYYRAWSEIFACKLAQLGEREMARLFRNDEQRFHQLTDAGRQYFFGPESNAENMPGVWLHRLVEAVAGCMVADCPMGPLGYRYGEDEGQWDVDLYPMPVELIGGAVDGQVMAPGFFLDIEKLRGLFERIDDMAWQSLGFPSDNGPHISIEGVFQGREVFLQVFAYAPKDEKPGMKLQHDIATIET